MCKIKFKLISCLLLVALLAGCDGSERGGDNEVGDLNLVSLASENDLEATLDGEDYEVLKGDLDGMIDVFYGDIDKDGLIDKEDLPLILTIEVDGYDFTLQINLTIYESDINSGIEVNKIYTLDNDNIGEVSLKASSGSEQTYLIESASIGFSKIENKYGSEFEGELKINFSDPQDFIEINISGLLFF